MSVHPIRMLAATRADETYNLWQVARILGVATFRSQRLVSYLTALVADHGFPRPLPAPRKKAALGGIHDNSQWRRVAVDLWLDGFLPDGGATALDEQALAAAAAAMDHAAASLGRPRLQLRPELRAVS